MKFHYQAVRADGSAAEGEREAPDRFALARDLRREGLTVTEAAEAGLGRRRFSIASLWRGKISLKDKIIFANSLSVMTGAGLSLSRSLEVVYRQTPNKRLKAIVSGLSDSVSRGQSLSQALSDCGDIFPPVFTAMVAAGEESGKLAQSLEVVRQQLAKSYDLRRKVQGAMIYPIIIIIVIIIIAILMMMFMVPSLTALFRDLKVQLPLSTRIIIGISDFLTQHTLAFVLAVLALSAAGVSFFRSERGRRMSTAVFMRTPAIKTIMMNLNTAVTMRTIASLVSSGVSLLNALAITEKVLQNFYYKQVLREAGATIQQGGTLSKVFRNHEKIYPILAAEMTEVGEEAGNLSGMLLKGAVFFEDEVDQATKNLSTIIEPALMVLIGIFVGLFAVSMLGPMYSLSSAI